MTPEKQRIAIAEVCGWKCFGHPDQILATKNWQFAYQFVISPTGEIVSHNSIPNYLSDLNACHEMEKVLSFGATYNQLGGFGLFKTALAEVCSEQHPINATAGQRAEAFLRTLGLWEEAL